MKSLALGCVSIVVGIFIGALLILLVAPALSVGGLDKAPADSVVAPSRSDLTISASAPFVNAQIQPAIRQSGIAKEATITFAAPNFVIMSAPVSVKLLGQTIQVSATTTLGLKVQNGRAVLTIEKVDANGFSVPPELLASYTENLRAQGEDQINRLVQRGLQGTTLRLTGIRVSSDAITMDLSSR